MSDMKIKMSILSVAVILLTGCGSSDDSSNSQVTNEGSTAIQSPADPLNANYYIDGIVYTLINGSLEQQIDDSDTLNKFKLTEFKASGDINKDGTDDTAVLLTNDAGENGVFYYIGILTSGPNAIIENTYFLGDRIVVKSINFVDGNFEVTYLDRDSETSFDQPPTIEIVGVTEIDMENNSFNFSCRDTAGFCLS